MIKIIQTPAQKVTFIGAIVNLFLSAIKIIGGILFQSAGLVADGLHSLSDLLSDAMVMIVLRISGKKPNKKHPWGHGRFETLGTALLGASLVFLAILIVYDSLINLLSYHTILTPSAYALIAIVLSIILKEWLYHYTLKIGRQIKSDLIIANAWHHRTDSLSSTAVLIGLIGALFGYVWLDSVAAIVVAILIFKIGFNFSKSAFEQLVDTALEPGEVKQLTDIAKSVNGVISVHDFKTRKTGSKTILEMHIQVAPFISSSESHQIGEKVVTKLDKKAKEIDIAHVIYHIDTYDDRLEKHSDYQFLPLRDEIEPIVQVSLAEINPKLKHQRMTLHYYKKRLRIELMFHQNDWNQFELNSEKVAQKVESNLVNQIPKEERRLDDWLDGIEIALLLN